MMYDDSISSINLSIESGPIECHILRSGSLTKRTHNACRCGRINLCISLCLYMSVRISLCLHILGDLIKFSDFSKTPSLVNKIASKMLLAPKIIEVKQNGVCSGDWKVLIIKLTKMQLDDVKGGCRSQGNNQKHGSLRALDDENYWNKTAISIWPCTIINHWTMSAHQ